MSNPDLKSIVEAALLAAGKPLDVDAIVALFALDEAPTREEVRTALDALSAECEGRGIELVRVASGWRYQVPARLAQWVSRLWEERPQRYSRALMETLALIAYRQPITRSEVEDVRGVAVSTNIIRTLLDRDWIRVVGQRDVPGRPQLFGTTRGFLDSFGLQSLEDLPSLAEIRDLDSISAEMELSLPGFEPVAGDGNDEVTGEQIAVVVDDPNADAPAALEKDATAAESPDEDGAQTLH
ncbi:MAG: SMC-Scp complex subunit ScpB [Chromatiales bacterium]|nr:SMC-Scp complex subunit ScpB [Chromatiales bacterium]